MIGSSTSTSYNHNQYEVPDCPELPDLLDLSEWRQIHRIASEVVAILELSQTVMTKSPYDRSFSYLADTVIFNHAEQ